jgi:hypothetical protein
MRYGISLPNASDCDARAAGELAHMAEEAGWDAVFLEDYQKRPAECPCLSPWG